MFRWIFFEPLRNARHVLLEFTGNGKIQNAGSLAASVFEVMGDPAGYEYKRAFS